MKCLSTHLLLTNHKCKFCIKCCFFKSLQRFTFPMPFLHCKFQLASNSRSPYFATMLFMASAQSNLSELVFPFKHGGSVGSAHQGFLAVRLERFGVHSLSFSVPSIWNALHLAPHTVETLRSFQS